MRSFPYASFKRSYPGRYPAKKIQHHWELCGPDVTQTVLKIVEGKDIVESITNIVLVLILKVPDPSSLS